MSYGIQLNLCEEYLMEEDLEERTKHVITSDQILHPYRRETMEMGFATMVPKNIFSPWYLKSNAFQVVTHE